MSDDPTPFSSFPLDELGYRHGSVILPNDSILFQFNASINDLSDPTFVQNIATATNNGSRLEAEVTFPVQTPISPIIDIIGPDTTLNCDEVIAAAVQDSCFQEGLLPQFSWSSRFVDSQHGPNFGGAEAIDQNRNRMHGPRYFDEAPKTNLPPRIDWLEIDEGVRRCPN